MSSALLGRSFDIHGGGNDLMFPHHENEIAQSRCVYPEDSFAKTWIHNEMLQVEGKKMSKSLDNFFTVRDLLDQGYPGEVIRFVFLSTHYRKPMDWTAEKAREAEATLRKWHELTERVEPGEVSDEVISRLASDLDTYGAREALRGLAKREETRQLLASARFLGLMQPSTCGWSKPIKYSEATGKKLDRVMRAWGDAIASKDYDRADDLRSRIDGAAIIVDEGLRQTDPLKFVRSLQADERSLFSVSIAEFVSNPQSYSSDVDEVMNQRADKLLEYVS